MFIPALRNVTNKKKSRQTVDKEILNWRKVHVQYLRIFLFNQQKTQKTRAGGWICYTAFLTGPHAFLNSTC